MKDFKKNSKNKEKKPYLIKNPWKIIAIICLIIFILILITGIFKAIKFQSGIEKIKKEQKEIAINIALKDIQEKKENLAYYEIIVPGKIRKIENNKRLLVPVTFKNNTESHLYLIDIDTKEIILKSDTYYYKQFPFFEKRSMHVPFDKRR